MRSVTLSPEAVLSAVVLLAVLSVAVLPEVAVEEPPQAARDRAIDAASTDAIAFFMFVFLLAVCSAFDGFIVPEMSKMRNRTFFRKLTLFYRTPHR